jgi:hypothetical protein
LFFRLSAEQCRSQAQHTSDPALKRGGVCEVTKELPETDDEFEYRIKSAIEPHERVARESDMTKA